MSWLYSVILAGLMFSTGSDVLFTGKQYETKNEVSSSQVVKLDETEKFEQTYPLSANGKVSVSNVNGSITIEAWDKNEVRLEAVKIADSKETLAEVEIKVDAQPNSFNVQTDYDNWKNRNQNGWKNSRKIEVQFRLIVPRTAILNEIETVNGSVTVSNFVNLVKASAVNGQVRATNLRGTANLSTVNGTVSVDFDQLNAGNKITLETVNGQVDLVIPSDSNAVIKADTLNGKIVNDFNLPVRKGQYVGKDLYGKIGSGEARIHLNSVNGNLSINRKNDGKNLSQPTNLLNEKNKNDDENWDEDEDGVSDAQVKVNVDTAKINADVTRSLKEAEKDRAASIKEAQKEVDAAMKEMQKELKNTNPEIARVAEESVRASMENLKNLKILDSEQLKAQIEKGNLQRVEALTRLAEINWTGNAPTIEKKTETFAVKGIPKVSVNANGCDVRVRGWDKPEVQYVVKKLSRSRDKKELPINVDAGESEVKITVVNNADDAGEFYGEGKQGVFVEVFVPKKSNLKIVTDGEIRLENVSGEVDLTGSDESINIRDVDGKLRLAAADGRVRIIGFRGELDAQTEDGEVFLEGDFTKITAKSTDGSIYLTLPENASALIKTNGAVGFMGENKVAGTFNANVRIGSPAISGESCAECPKNMNFVKESEDTWRIGKGDSKYNFNFNDGILYLRNTRAISSN